MSRLRSQDGFTLIEVIVALALLSLIMVIMGEAVRSARNVLAFVERSNAASAIAPGQSYLRSVLAQAIPPGLSIASVTGTRGLRGDPSSVRVNTLYAMRGQIQGAYHIEVFLEPMTGTASAFNLVAVQTPIRPLPAEGSDVEIPSQRLKIASNVVSAAFAYFGTRDAEPGVWQWFDSWSSTERLPRLVRVDVTLAPGQAQVWRRLEFPLQLAD